MDPKVHMLAEERVAAARFEVAAGTVHPVPNHLRGKGIVTCAGGNKYLPSAFLGVNQLRRLGCSLPIEMWHFEGEMPRPWPSFFEPLGVHLVNASIRLASQPIKPTGGWQLKSFAMAFCHFREVLFLDADNFAVEDPAHLFDEPEYLRTGGIFWMDSHRMLSNERIWEICGIEPSDEPEFESGQILVDKCRCWQELMLALYMNEHSDFFYRYLYGDKDTFRFAWHKLHRAFATPSTPAYNPLTGSMYQPGFHGRRLFQHRTWYKWTLEENRREPEFWFHDECIEMIEELRQKLGRPSRRHGQLRMYRRTGV